MHTCLVFLFSEEYLTFFQVAKNALVDTCYVPDPQCVAQWLEHCVSSTKVVGSIPREHMY